MPELQIESDAYSEDLRCRDSEIQAMNRDYKTAMRKWNLEHNH